MRILTAIVTHNRCDLLQRCLTSVAEQTLQPSEVLVVDNGSSDGTSLFLSNSEVTSIRQTNQGSAGGWHTCIQYALDTNADFVWLMDDDGFPAPNALELLYSNYREGLSCISSVVINESNHDLTVFPFPKKKTSPLSRLWPLPRRTSSYQELSSTSSFPLYPFAHLFNGALIPLSAIRHIGNVRKELYLYGDELDYFYRLLQIGSIASLIPAIHFHPEAVSRPLTTKKIYYGIRNAIIVNLEHKRKGNLRALLSVCSLLHKVLTRNGPIYFFRLLLGSERFLLYKAVYFGINREFTSRY